MRKPKQTELEKLLMEVWPPGELERLLAEITVSDADLAALLAEVTVSDDELAALLESF